MSKLLLILERWFSKTFCVHSFLGVSDNIYDVVSDKDGSKKGEVKLLHLRCSNCGYEKIIPVDMTHLILHDQEHS